MIHPLGYWWRRRAAKRQEERRRANRQAFVPSAACAAAPRSPRALSSPELRGRYLRVLEMRQAGLKFREIAGYLRTGNRPVTAQRARQVYLLALSARERGVI